MPIYKQKGYYYIKIQVDGEKWTPKKAGFEPSRWRKRREAKVAEARLRQFTEEIRLNQKSGTTETSTDLLTLCNEYLDDAEVSCLGHDTLAGKKRFCREIMELWGNTPCTDISIHMVHQYLIGRARRVSNNSFNVYRKEGRRLFEWGKKHGLVPRTHINPFAEIEKKPHATGKPRPAPIDSVIKAYLVASPDQKDLLLTYLVTGARKSEILTWTWADVDFLNRVYALHTRKTGSRSLKTTHHEMPDLLYNLLQRRYRKRHSTLPYVFWHRFWDRKSRGWREDRYQNLNRFTVRLCERAKVSPFNLHQLRHLATSVLKDKGNMSLAQLQRFLRHDHQKTTEIYAGHIEMGTRKQTDYLADFWQRKLIDSDTVASIKSSIQIASPQTSIFIIRRNNWSDLAGAVIQAENTL